MFDINGFIMKTLIGMIGKYPDFQVREYALNWYAKGKITEENLAKIDALIEAQYIEPPVVEEPIEDETLVENETDLTETETEVEETIEDSTNEEVVKETTTEPTE